MNKAFCGGFCSKIPTLKNLGCFFLHNLPLIFRQGGDVLHRKSRISLLHKTFYFAKNKPVSVRLSKKSWPQFSPHRDRDPSTLTILQFLGFFDESFCFKCMVCTQAMSEYAYVYISSMKHSNLSLSPLVSSHILRGLHTPEKEQGCLHLGSITRFVSPRCHLYMHSACHPNLTFVSIFKLMEADLRESTSNRSTS